MKRTEKKYVFDKRKLHHILINAKAFKEFPSRQINSIYFDTYDFKDFKDNFEGTVPRKKVRLRFYGNSSIKDLHNLRNYYLEIKKTSYSSRSKKSIHLKYDLNKILNLIESKKYFTSSRFPRTFVSYKRNYFKTINGIRITVDTNIIYKKINKNFESLNTYSENKIVLEVKNESKLTDDPFEYNFLENFRTRFSKYYNSVEYNYFR
ncbi:VTC domain-containing protein [Candidatus Pelagibacter sp.]|nr:VTC domain-containing protein [Candidatus Pelagibacter sp.]